MTVPTSLARAQYDTNATTGPWTVPFYFLADSDLQVVYTDAAGLETPLVLDTDFTVTGAGDPLGGTVTTTTAYASGGFVTILRDMDYTQEVDYTETDSFPAETHEQALDRLTMLAQQVKEKVDRAIVFSPSDEEGSELPAAVDRASQLLGFDSLGRLSLNAPTSGTAADLALDLASIATQTKGAGMVGFDVALAYAAFTVGSAIKDLGVSALWYMTAAQRTSVLAGNLVEDVTTPVQAAITAAYGRSLYMPGRYKITSGLSVTGRVKIYGDHPVSSEIVYRTAATSANALFDFDNVDNILIEDLALTNSASSGGQATTAVQCQGDLGSVTEVKLRNVYIDGFMKYGVKFHSGALYITLDGVRIMNCTNDVAAGGTGVGNAVALYFGTTVNAITINDCRISSNDEVINGDTTAKYCLTISNSKFEINGETGTPGDTITLYGWHGVVFSGNYCEANKTGTSVDDSFLRLQACAAVRIEGGLINGSSGGTGKSKNLIGISDTCVGVTVENVELQDPITKYVYVADGNSLTKLSRNRYQFGGAYKTTYDTIMANMTAALVELDLSYPASVTTGVIASGGNYQANFTVTGVDVTRNAAITATPLNGGSDFIWSCAAVAADTVRVMAYNVKGSDNSFTGTVAIRVLKDG